MERLTDGAFGRFGAFGTFGALFLRHDASGTYRSSVVGNSRPRASAIACWLIRKTWSRR